jgi:hypothetical protein
MPSLLGLSTIHNGQRLDHSIALLGIMAIENLFLIILAF